MSFRSPPSRRCFFLESDGNPTIGAGQFLEDTWFTTQADIVFEFAAAYLSVPAIGGSTGSHAIEIYQDEPTLGLMSADYVSTEQILFRTGYFRGAPTMVHPPDGSALVALLGKGMANSIVPFVIRYTNNSNVSQTGAVDYKFSHFQTNER